MVSATVVFEPEGKKVPNVEGKSLLDLARGVGVDLQGICAGQGTCGKCRILVRSGADCLSGLADLERRLLSKDEISKLYRLACTAYVHAEGQISVEVPDESRIGQQRLLAGGIVVKVPLKPTVRKIFIQVEPPTLEDVRSDEERITAAIEKKTGPLDVRISYEALKEMPFVARKADWKLTAVIRRNREILWLEPSDTTQNCYGLAIDVGSTKLAMHLLDLNTGRTVSTASKPNPQMAYGEDIISRTSFLIKDKNNLTILHKVVIEAVNEMIDQVCEKEMIDRRQIYEVTIAANTAMHHIFLNISPHYVGLAPYAAVMTSPFELKSRELGIDINPSGYVYTLPNVSGYVGADAIADVLTTGLYKSDGLEILIDIGTNTEIVLGNKEKLIACSAPSGPAFEGAQIKHGMRAGAGAIESIWIDEKTLEPRYETIGRIKPSGICGSGIIDVVAEMLKAGIIDRKGKINSNVGTKRIRQGEKYMEYVVEWGENTATEQDIVVTQKDVREIQLAKATTHTGAAILMKRMGVKPTDLNRLYIAGAFGTYLDVQNARIIGMYPDIPLERIKFVGNAAGSGARMALLSEDIRSLAHKLAVKIGSRVELAADPDFQKEFVKSTDLPHSDIDRFPSVKRLLNIQN